MRVKHNDENNWLLIALILPGPNENKPKKLQISKLKGKTNRTFCLQKVSSHTATGFFFMQL